MVLRLLSLAILVVAAPLAAQDPLPARKRATLVVQPVKKTQGPAGWLGFRHSAERDSLVVLEVAPGSPAERAGLRTGDLITMVGNRVATRQLLLDNPPMIGDSRRLTVRRDRDTLTLEIIAVAPPSWTLKPTRAATANADTVAVEARRLRGEMVRQSVRATMPARGDTLSPALVAEMNRVLAELKHSADKGLPVGKQVDSVTYAELARTVKNMDRLAVKLTAAPNALSGAEFEQLNPGLAEYFGGVSEGMFVLRVAPGTPAATAGLQPGDILEMLNGERIETMAELRAGAEAAGPLTLHVIRKGRSATITLRKE